MPQVKIRHALATWQEGKDGPVLTAFRGQVVDMPQEHVDRLRGHGAVVNPEIELDRPGILMELPESPSDEELVNWVMSASPAEVQDITQRRPELRQRLDGAALRVTDDRRRMDEHLQSVRTAISGMPSGTVIDDDLVLGPLSKPATGTDEGVGQAPEVAPQDPVTSAGAGAAQPASLANLVLGTVGDVTGYIREHPEEAQDVLEAEAEARDGKPRAGVVAAVQAVTVQTPQQ